MEGLIDAPCGRIMIIMLINPRKSQWSGKVWRLFSLPATAIALSKWIWRRAEIDLPMSDWFSKMLDNIRISAYLIEIATPVRKTPPNAAKNTHIQMEEAMISSFLQCFLA